MRGSDASTGLFTGLLLLSGYCGLSYEVLYGRLLGNLAGDQFAVSASILIAFLLGIGFGSRSAHRLWPHLWLVEAGIGLSGLLLALGTPLLDGPLHDGLPGLIPGLFNTVVVCVLVLAVPSFLIGCSMPLFAGYWQRLHPAPGFSWAYGFYNLGAASTVLLIEFVILRQAGLRLTILSVALVNLFTAFVLRYSFNGLRAPPPSEGNNNTAPLSRSLLAALLVASLGSAVFQLLMVKLAELLLGPFREHFALVLVLILGGLAGGAALVERFRLSFAGAMVLSLVGLAWLVAGLLWTMGLFTAPWVSTASTLFGAPALKGVLLAILMALPALGFGATLPALLADNRQDIARHGGHLLYLASLANVAGFLLMVFGLHPYLSYGGIVLAVAVCAASAWMLTGKALLTHRLAPLMLLGSAFLLHGFYWEERLLYLGHSELHEGRNLKKAIKRLTGLDIFKGPQDVMAITHSDRPFFLVNGSISIPLDSAAEVIVGAFASSFAPRPHQALVLGVGSGKTASAVTQLFDHTDAVEINAAILDNLAKLGRYNFNLHEKKNVRFHLDDAIHFVRHCPRPYDLILNTVMTPLYFSSSKLYTADFFQDVARCLAPDGVYMTWFDSSIGDEGARIILKTIGERFPHVRMGMVRHSYFLLLASNQPLQLHGPERVRANAVLSAHLLEEEEILPEWVPYGLLHTDPVDYVRGGDAPLNTLDHPVLEFSMARLREKRLAHFKQWLLETLDPESLKAALGEALPWKATQQSLYLAKRDSSGAFVARFEELTRQRQPDFDADKQREQRHLRTEVARRSDTAKAFTRAAERLFEDGDPAGAMPMLQAALQRPGNQTGRLLYRMARCHEALSQWDDAIDWYLRAIENDGSRTVARLRLGELLIRQGRAQEATPQLLQALVAEDDKAKRQEIYRVLQHVAPESGPPTEKPSSPTR
ncbi:MAG: tetratricopeptide repeat protein [Magnetococcales bacterium]|nr:tetratricopeptide repeat protein [Magnetococcales bacterium]